MIDPRRTSNYRRSRHIFRHKTRRWRHKTIVGRVTFFFALTPVTPFHKPILRVASRLSKYIFQRYSVKQRTADRIVFASSQLLAPLAGRLFGRT